MDSSTSAGPFRSDGNERNAGDKVSEFRHALAVSNTGANARAPVFVRLSRCVLPAVVGSRAASHLCS